MTVRELDDVVLPGGRRLAQCEVGDHSGRVAFYFRHRKLSARDGPVCVGRRRRRGAARGLGPAWTEPLTCTARPKSLRCGRGDPCGRGASRCGRRPRRGHIGRRFACAGPCRRRCAPRAGRRGGESRPAGPGGPAESSAGTDLPVHAAGARPSEGVHRGLAGDAVPRPRQGRRAARVGADARPAPHGRRGAPPTRRGT